MTVNSFSLYQLSPTSLGYFDQDGCLFDACRYSQFKYGCHVSARIYADQIAERLLRDYGHWQNEQVIVCASAYKVAPTAAEAIAQLVYESLQGYFPLLQKAKVRRETVFANDYGSMPTADRFSLMDRNILTIDDRLFRHKKLILVDDLRVTGAHERKLTDTISGVVDEVVFAYVGFLQGDFLPSVEFDINNTAITSVNDILRIIEKGLFHVNARVCKYVLSYQNLGELRSFLLNIPPAVLSRLDECICGDGYHVMPEYETNYLLLREVLEGKPALLSLAV
ncbi:phosphoribosyltransferase family protein [uncultured Imperialibacter sp.]|uniref:phosphoribosyltransferase family protein n=1 Tax=uncultured Imperialibacter sp. TaxID=1672639 RepID=UPI0030D9B142|tara:strand:+ start:27993 stop:28832 length:840 start_codon:yes stop_codon:yes gene_type:complete